MLRSINARAIAQSRLQLGAVRRISMARPTSALAKRPELPRALPRAGPSVLGMMPVRHISFFGGNETAAPAAPAPAPVAPVAPVEAEAASASAASTAGTAPAIATPEAPLSTPVPASDIPAVPAETPLPGADHLTSAAPDHHLAGQQSLHDLIANSNLPLETVLNSPEAMHTTASIADLKLMGLDHGVLNIAGWFRDALVGLHGISGLPWWATIAVFTLGLRTCLLPIIVKNLRHNVRLAAVSPQMQALMKRVNEAKAAGDSGAMAVASTNLQKLFKEHSVNPFAPLIVPLFQMPVFLGMFYALRGLAKAPLPELKLGGLAWVHDLTVPDPLFILPLTSILLQLTVFKVGVDGTGPNGARNARTMAHFRNGMLVMSPLLALMVSQFPAAVLFYWTTTNAFTLMQAFLLRQPFVKKLLRIPEPPKVEAPPADLELDPNPSIKDTWKAFTGMRDNFANKVINAKAAADQASADAAAERASRRPVGSAQLVEKVSEPRASSATVETTPAPSRLFEGEDGAPQSREDARRARVEAARAKRANRS